MIGLFGSNQISSRHHGFIILSRLGMRADPIKDCVDTASVYFFTLRRDL